MAEQSQQNQERVFVARTRVQIDGKEHPAGTELCRVRVSGPMPMERLLPALAEGLAQPKEHYEAEQRRAGGASASGGEQSGASGEQSEASSGGGGSTQGGSGGGQTSGKSGASEKSES